MAKKLDSIEQYGLHVSLLPGELMQAARSGRRAYRTRGFRLVMKRRGFSRTFWRVESFFFSKLPVEKAIQANLLIYS
jgi:hypothetical protein